MRADIFEAGRTAQGLERVHQAFMAFLEKRAPDLAQRYQAARDTPADDASALMVAVAPHLEDFLRDAFNLAPEPSEEAREARRLFELRRDFIQRHAVPEWGNLATSWTEADVLRALARHFPPQPITGPHLAAAIHSWLEAPEIHQDALLAAAQYCAWAIVSEAGQLRHRGDPFLTLPQKLDAEARVPHLENLAPDALSLNPAWGRARDGFAPRDTGISEATAQMEANYCLWCHERSKDTCRTGIPKTDHAGCPLGQKISEMAFFKAQGFSIAALAVAMVDNPLIAATGHRICNDCMKSCIYQKQTPVQIPALESRILKDVLDVPFGVELYLLLTQWNPLNFKAPLPAPATGRQILIVGLGPAGFTLAHHLLRLGHTVVAMDGMPITPLPQTLINTPISNFETLEAARAHGFGGVMDYGITARWEKHALTLIQLALERQPRFLALGGTFWGGQVTLESARKLGFDHIALATGAGQPKIQDWPGISAPGVMMAADFLMALNTLEPFQESSPAARLIELPVVVIGGGLTAIDAATEALAYYPAQVTKFAAHYAPDKAAHWTPAEQARAATFLAHAAALQQERDAAERAGRPPDFRALLASWGGATILYRKSLTEAPAYRLSPEEVTHALEEGVCFLQNRTPLAFHQDAAGALVSVETMSKDKTPVHVPARTVLLALGVQDRTPDTAPDLTIVGDLDPRYAGSVVKAMASSAHAAPRIHEKVMTEASRAIFSLEALQNTLKESTTARVVHSAPLEGAFWALTLHAPWAAAQFRPGHLYRLQKPGLSEPVAMRPMDVDPAAGTLTFLLRVAGASTRLLSRATPGETLTLMGPTGTPTPLPDAGPVLLIGEGAQALLLLPQARAMRAAGRLIFLAVLNPDTLTRAHEADLNAASDHMIYADDLAALAPALVQAGAQHLSAVQTLFSGPTLEKCSDLPALLHPFLAPDAPILTSPPATLNCMMKGVCGACLQRLEDPLTGAVIFTLTCQTPDQPLTQVDPAAARGRLAYPKILETLFLS